MIDYQKIEDRLNDLRGKDYISESTVDFFADILKAQYDIKEKLTSGDALVCLNENEVKEKLKKSIPILSWDNIPVTEMLLDELFIALCNILIKHENADKQELENLIKLQSSGDLNLIRMIEKFYHQDSSYFASLSEDLKINAEILLFISLQLAKPFFESMAEKMPDKYFDEQWLKNYCPVCGSQAQISTLAKEDGKRTLYCMMCGSHWRSMLFQCSFCGDNQVSGMKFLAEDAGPYQIDFCSQCKRYIKTFDERKISSTKKEFIPSVEDIATMYLDVLAEKEGYERSWFPPASVEKLESEEESKTIH